MKFNNKLISILILLCLLAIGITIFISRNPLPKNEIIFVEDETGILNFLQKNTPTRIKVITNRWNDIWIEEPGQVFEIWNSLNNLYQLLQPDERNNPTYELEVEYFDGNTDRFYIQSPRVFSRSQFFSSQLELEYVKLTNALIGEVYSSNNLAELIEESEDVFIFESERQYPDNMNRTFKLVEEQKEELVKIISESDKILDDTIINDYLLEDRYSPSHHIMFVPENDGRFTDVISILSPGIYFYTDTDFTHRTNIYYTGNLYNFVTSIISENQ